MTQELANRTCKPSSTDPKPVVKKRLRVRGKKVESIEQVKNWIYDLIVAIPKTPRQLSNETGFSRMHVWRYTDQLLQEGKIEKDGHYYKKKGLSSIAVERERVNDLLSKQSFSKIPIVQPMIQNMMRRDLISRIARDEYSMFRSICMGRIVPSFKCHPKNWHAHETTIAFRDAYFKYKDCNRLPNNVRYAIRTFYQLCLKYQFSSIEAKLLGIDAANDAQGKYADCKFSNAEDFGNLINYFLEQNNLELAAYVAIAVETFGRPGSIFRSKISDFRLANDRMVRTKATWDRDWLYDDALVAERRTQIEINPKLKERIAIEEIELEIFEGKLHESKTDYTWPKEIRDPLAVSTIKRWIAGHSERMFGNKNESFKKFSARVNAELKEAYRAIGLGHQYFYKRPSYALRHCGAHLWLLRTGYNYDAVASMGWGEVNTLRQYYGKYDPSQRKRSYKQAY